MLFIISDFYIAQQSGRRYHHVARESVAHFVYKSIADSGDNYVLTVCKSITRSISRMMFSV